jgi:hypothetical protein
LSVATMPDESTTVRRVDMFVSTVGNLRKGIKCCFPEQHSEECRP